MRLMDLLILGPRFGPSLEVFVFEGALRHSFCAFLVLALSKLKGATLVPHIVRLLSLSDGSAILDEVEDAVWLCQIGQELLACFLFDYRLGLNKSIGVKLGKLGVDEGGGLGQVGEGEGGDEN